MQVLSYARLSALVLGLLSVGCSATLGDLGNLTESVEACPPGGNPNELRALDLHLTAVGVHAFNLFEATVISETSGVLASRVIYDPLVEGTIDIHVPNAVPPGDYFLDFYADLDNDRRYTSPPFDHTWRRPVCDDGSLTFVHLAVFEDLDNGRPIGGPFELTATNIPLPAQRGAFEVHVVADFDAGITQTVGVYRFTNNLEMRVIPLPDTVSITIPDILDGGTTHRVFYFFDVDRDGIADATAGDLICLTTAVASGTGIDLTVDVGAERTAGNCELTELPEL
jgi:hypothetical protein